MSETAAVTTTVMFADICDSTLLFSRLGDEAAFKMIDSALKLSADLIKRHAGVVLRTKGDDVLCIFSDPFNAISRLSALASTPVQHCCRMATSWEIPSTSLQDFPILPRRVKPWFHPKPSKFLIIFPAS